MKGKKNYECDSCGNEFVTKQSLKQHSKVGQLDLYMKGKNNFECDLCSYKFQSWTVISVHERKEEL